jgi:hypothetical protein
MWTGKNRDEIDWDGTIFAKKFVGDGSGLTGTPAGTEYDPVFLAASAAYNLTVTEFQTTSAAYISHAADATIHFTSGAIWSSLALINTEYATTSAAYIAHAADTSDPHGQLLTQTYISLTSGAVTADITSSGAALIRNILIGTEASPGAASNWTQGTIYLKYTA